MLKVLFLLGALTAPRHSELLRMLDVVLGETTYAQLQRLFGVAASYGDGDGHGPRLVCYTDGKASPTFIEFDSGAGEEGTSVLGASLTKDAPSKTCQVTKHVVSQLASAHGIMLGMSREAVIKALYLSSKGKPDDTVIIDETGSDGCPYLRLTLRFSDGLLVSYSVRRLVLC